ncbi:ABC transporter ATP-binding protein [Butyrivibrio sp. MC2021]|uniref:ABC transporter ATP-binding protein n=1 Tax=Butyrivibrio sp. MC2021 TaxID=1408306 RepID=UPI000479DC92|nr:ABC transporter ATP-binding protein [Butyrivibrio sp. MC2021]
MGKEPEKKKPKYNSWQNTKYMVGLAWKNCKSVLVIAGLIALTGVALTTVQLLIAPLILKQIELHESITKLLLTIAIFTALLILMTAFKRYLQSNALYGRVEIRMHILKLINIKRGSTSYENLFTKDFRNGLNKALEATSMNSRPTEAVWNTLTELVTNIIGFIIYLLIVSRFDIRVILLVLFTTVTGFFINKKIDNWDYLHKDEKAEHQRKMNYLHGVMLSRKGAKDVRIFGLDEWFYDIRGSLDRTLNAFYYRREKNYFLTNVVDMVLTITRNGVAYAYLIYNVLEKGMSASEFLLYFGAISGFTAWVSGILGQLLELHKQSGDLSFVRELIEWEEPFRFEDGKKLIDDKNTLYEIKLENVSYRYPGAENDTITDMNMTLKAGEKLAIVGQNGAGKTTLVKLITGLLDPTKGKVLLNGVDIRVYNRADYYGLFSSVFQEFSVLEASLKENVSQCAEDIDEDKVIRCLEQAGLLEKAKQLPQGIETKIGRAVFSDGVELSGGQTQRLMLARALYKDGPILALDEPTAALDPIAENDIYMKYDEMTSGKTSLFISHRLASTRFCDRIVFLKDGKIIEDGTHQELLEKGGEYANLFEVQSKYYREGGAAYEDEYENEKAI